MGVGDELAWGMGVRTNQEVTAEMNGVSVNELYEAERLINWIPRLTEGERDLLHRVVARVGQLEAKLARQTHIDETIAGVERLKAELARLEAENDLLREIAIDWAMDEWYGEPTPADLDGELANRRKFRDS